MGVALYSAVDNCLTHYVVDVEAATLSKRGSMPMPAKVQYAWPHPSKRFFYVATSSGGPHIRSDRNHVTALKIAPDGALYMHGAPRSLARRAVHVCVDPAGRYLLSAHNYQGGGVTVHRIEKDGTLLEEVPQVAGLDYGIYPHQVMAFPSGRAVVLVDRGVDPKADKAEEPGALRTFGFQSGALVPDKVIAPGGGYGFGPRHVAFHPRKPWLYVSDERTNRLSMFGCANDSIDAEPSYVASLLAEPDNVRPRQLGGPIHVHPSGSFVYVANRSDYSVATGDRNVFLGGENNIAVFSIDQNTGKPTLIQHAPTRSFHVRTFALDPSGRLLVAASIRGLSISEPEQNEFVPAALSVFRVGQDGALSFKRKYDIVTTGSRLQYWAGMIGVG